jgi:type IV pilus assembly protein PilB
MTYSSSKKNRAIAVRNNLSPFGNQLVQKGFIDGDKMQKALAESRKTGHSLIDILESATGKLLPPDLLRQYKKHHLFELKVLFGVESADPEIETEKFSNHQIGELINSLIPIDLCRRYRLIPLYKKEGDNPILVVAMVDPENLEAQDDLNRILRPKGIGIERQVITQSDYQQLIDQFLDEQVKQETAKKKEVNVDVSLELDNFDFNLEEGEDELADDLGAANEAQAAPIITLVNKILAKALQDGVSDIHVEPQEEGLKIRYRKDSVLQQPFDRMPKKIIPAVIARFKIMAELDIAEKRLPQDGKIRRMFQGRKVDFRVNTLPSRYGEKVVLRILDNSATQLGLDKLISHEETLEIVRDMARKPFGMILVTGPTGITQVQVIREKGMDFSSILRAFLRQDPDVILVGETRDSETAKTSIEAALTGHLVLTTLHTNDAAGAISRLDEMGVEPFMISGALVGVLAQRLMRKVCTECRIAYNPTYEELARYGLSAAAGEEVIFYKAHKLEVEQLSQAKANGTLCPKCQGGGYKGRVGVYEVMRNSEKIQTLINEGANTDRIKEVAVEEGMITILAYSLNLVKEGQTTLEEVERVTFTDSGLEAELKAKRKSGLTCRSCRAELLPEWLDCPYCMTSRF